MSLKGVAAVVGLAERAPQRYTGNETNLDLLSGVAIDAMTDAGIDRTDVDQPARLTKNAPAASGRRRSSSRWSTRPDSNSSEALLPLSLRGLRPLILVAR